ncbi:MAG: hypothetical protein J6M12_06350 [Clostridia bacterium]|nr:hypothetical protein [Clostridia bacterium]
MDKKYLLNHLLYLVSTLIAAVLIGYVIFHLSGSGESNLSTAIARRISAGQQVTGQAYIFKEETVLEIDGTGAVYSKLTDGQRVQTGSSVASVYNTDAQNVLMLRGYDAAIALLKEANGKKSGSAVELQLKELTAAIRADLQEGNSASAQGQEQQLQVLLNLRKTVTGNKKNFDKEISELSALREGLLQSLGEATKKVYAPISGNYYALCDGYEQFFSSDKLEDLTPEGFKALIKDIPEGREDGTTAGKLQTSSTWHAALLCSDRSVLEMTVGKSYTLTFGDKNNYTMTLTSLKPTADEDGVLLVFSCDRVPTPGSLKRSEQVTFCIEEHQGLMVPTAAVRYLKAPEAEDGQEAITDDTGVYVKTGNKIAFKRIRILCQGEGYYVVKEWASDEQNAAAYLQLNDVIVTSGKNLEEGYRN